MLKNSVRSFGKLNWNTYLYVAFRKNLPYRGHNTNNLVESQFLVLKDSVLNRTKEVNINGLLDRVIKDLDDHYKTKLISVANGRFEGM